MLNPTRVQNFIGLMLLFLTACQPFDYVPLTTPTASVSDQMRPTQEIPTEMARATAYVTQSATPASPQRLTPTPTGAPLGDCVDVTFIQDVTIPDGSQFQPDEIFLKIWRLRNSGTCNWPPDLRLEFVAGTPLNGADSVPARFYPEGLPLTASMGEPVWADSRIVSVEPNMTIDIPVMFQAPGEPGESISLWALRSLSLEEDLVQVYVDIRVEGLETPEPTRWGGTWVHFQQHAGVDGAQLNLEQRGGVVRGFYYGSDGELFLLEGGVFGEGSRIEGSFGPPHHDGFHFNWIISPDSRTFQGSYQDRIIASGAWCGAREGQPLPDPCLFEP